MSASEIPVSGVPSSSDESRPPLRPAIPIVYVIDKMGSGSAQTYLGGLIQSLDRRRFLPSLVCLIRGGVVAKRLGAAGVTVKVLGFRRIYEVRAARAFVGLVSWLRKTRPQIVHTFLSTANVYGALAARAAGVPFLVATRLDAGKGRLMLGALRATDQWATKVVAASRDGARILREREGLGDQLLEVVPNAIDLARFTPRGRRARARAALRVVEPKRVVVTVTRLSRAKGVDLLVEAAARIRCVLPRTLFLVVGSGEEEERIAQRVAKLGLDARVRLLGERTDVPDILEAADLFVLPARSSGQPDALLEAMAMGLPIVATRVGGVPELVNDGEEALLVEPGGAEALAEGCLKLLTEPGLGARLGRAAQERVRGDFGLGRTACRYESLYEKLLGASP